MNFEQRRALDLIMFGYETIHNNIANCLVENKKEFFKFLILLFVKEQTFSWGKPKQLLYLSDLFLEIKYLMVDLSRMVNFLNYQYNKIMFFAIFSI